MLFILLLPLSSEKKKEGYRLTFKGGQNWTQNKLVVAEKLGVFRLLGSGKSGIVK